MAWQIAPGAIIISLGFTATGFGLRALDWLFLDRRRRVRITQFENTLDQRTKLIKEFGSIDQANKARHNPPQLL